MSKQVTTVSRVGTNDPRLGNFVDALAEFLAGTNQARMSVALEVARRTGIPNRVAELWQKMRLNCPIHGYASVDEARAALTPWLSGGWL
jgi:hypothetical protein